MRTTTIIALAFAIGAMAAGVMALPEPGAAMRNADIRTLCAQVQAARPSTPCPSLRPEGFRLEWLLIAAVLAVGAGIVFAIGDKRRDDP